jgi:hypothetical protein
MFIYCSHMAKPRRKDKIRAQALRIDAALQDEAKARAAVLLPAPRSWHEPFLRAIQTGASIERAACAAGITRQGVYYARLHQPSFAVAFRTAYKIALKARGIARWQAFDARDKLNRSTTEKTISTQNIPDDSVTLDKSNFTLRVGPNGPTQGYPLRCETMSR